MAKLKKAVAFPVVDRFDWRVRPDESRDFGLLLYVEREDADWDLVAGLTAAQAGAEDWAEVLVRAMQADGEHVMVAKVDYVGPDNFDAPEIYCAHGENCPND